MQLLHPMHAFCNEIDKSELSTKEYQKGIQENLRSLGPIQRFKNWLTIFLYFFGHYIKSINFEKITH